MRLHLSRGPRKRRLILPAIIIFAVLLLFSQGSLVTVLAPVSSTFVSFGTWISNKTFWWRKSLNLPAQELEDLHQDLTQLAKSATEFEQLREENDLLRNELKFIERFHPSSISARIIAKSISHSASRFVIDAGLADGVEVGSAVVSGEGIFVGKIIETSEHSSIVKSLTDPTSSFAVGLLNESRTIGLARGSVGDLLDVQYIPSDETVKENDLVVTSGLEGSIPSGLLVGIVNAVEQQIGSPFQQAIVQPIEDIRRLSIVLILDSAQSP